jgi:hypothetical protein
MPQNAQTVVLIYTIVYLVSCLTVWFTVPRFWVISNSDAVYQSYTDELRSFDAPASKPRTLAIVCD